MSREARVVRYHADALDVIPTLADESVDAVVTDPPYGLEFMGREWDRFAGKVSDRDFKGFVLSQQRTRNVKCPDCDKWAYDHPGRLCECGGVRRAQGNAYQHWCEAWARECFRVLKPGGHLLAFGGTRTSHRLAVAVEDAGFEIRDSIVWIYGSGFPKSLDVSKAIDKAAGAAAPATDDAKRWAGWGTAIKPAHESIVVARKPLIGTVAANVLAHGTGALNIDATRVQYVNEADRAFTESHNQHAMWGSGPRRNNVLGDMSQNDRAVEGDYDASRGRWPANVVLDENAAAELDEQSGTLKVCRPYVRSASVDNETYGVGAGHRDSGFENPAYGDVGGASRFFPVFRYQAKAPTRERVKIDGVAHPTVKPLELMRWLVRLVTPIDGVVLEPFAGSGTTVEACILEGMRCLAIEREESYLPLIAQRIERAGLVAW